MQFRLFFLILVTALKSTCFAQFSLQGASDISSLKWWIGLKTGVQFSKANVIENHSVSTPEIKKEYGSLTQNIGQSIGAIFGYAITQRLLITLQPNYSNYKYTYRTSYNAQNTFGDAYQLTTFQNHRIGYLETPLIFIFRTPVERFEPYLHAGAYAGFFTGGKNKIEYKEQFKEGGLVYDEKPGIYTQNLNDKMMKSQFGLQAGAGVFYTIQYFRIGFELGYKTGLFNMTDVKQRFSDSKFLSSYMDIPDDLKLNHICLSVNLFMPVDNLVHLHSGQKSKAGRNK